MPGIVRLEGRAPARPPEPAGGPRGPAGAGPSRRSHGRESSPVTAGRSVIRDRPVTPEPSVGGPRSRAAGIGKRLAFPRAGPAGARQEPDPPGDPTVVNRPPVTAGRSVIRNRPVTPEPSDGGAALAR